MPVIGPPPPASDPTSIDYMRGAVEDALQTTIFVDDDIIPYMYAVMFQGSFEPLPYDIYQKYSAGREGTRVNAGGISDVLTVLLSASESYYDELAQAEKESAGAGGKGGAGQPLGGSLYEPIGNILGMGGRAAREMAYQDPASFINLLSTEAAGDQPVNQMLRNFLIDQAPRLYSLAGLEELLGRVPETEAMTRTQDIFKQFVTPGSPFVGGRQSVMQSLTELAGKPERQPGFAEARPQEYFDDAFFLAQNVIAPTMTPTMAGTLFSNARRELERATYVTSVAQGKFTGSPLEWLKSRGYF